MPLVEITLAQGRSEAQLRDLLHRVTYAVHDAVAAPVDSIRVVLREVPLTHWAAGDVTIAERQARQEQSHDTQTAGHGEEEDVR